ncbi:MAG: glycoside hydrolase family 3 C-terminal domain-containing protein [Bacteroidota bacterium]|nr:glycoside hydrolase family 3 C-terminal domain-containing protein [Bacteroidota bacterium]
MKFFASSLCLLFVVLQPAERLLARNTHTVHQSSHQLPFQNPNLPVEERVNDLVSKMTLEEKVSQMVYNSPAIERFGIPPYNWWNEALHGIARNGIATVFPQSIGLAAMWDRELLYRVATVISDEARAKYNRALKHNRHGIYQGITLWSPNINIFRDPRWGRGMETYGEDPYLTGELAVQYVKGLQGSDSRYLKTVATPKHFAVYSGPEPERHTFNAVVSEYDLRETYLPQFKKAVQEGNAQAVMCAYNSVLGEPCCGSNLLIRSILRGEWGFNGVMVSDCWAIPDIVNFHKIVSSNEEAASLAVKAGTDLECGNAFPSLVNAVKQGLITEAAIDTAVKRLFTARFKLGMFDPPAMVPYSALNEIDTPGDRALALDAARKSLVLLKNESSPSAERKKLLPLSKNVKTIAVVGPNANDVESLLGNYNGFPSHPITPLQGIRTKLPHAKVLYERGCQFAERIPSFDVVGSSFLFTSERKDEHGLQGEYFDNRELKGEPVFTRVDSAIDFAWWDGAPDTHLHPDNFGIQWSGVLVPEKSGTYELGGYGYNDFKIYLEDTLLVNFRGEFDPVKTYRQVNLTAGKSYRIKIEFAKRERYSFMQLIWSVPDEQREQRAIEAARKADIVVLVMGLSPRLEGEEMRVNAPGFRGGDRLSLGLPELQSSFIKKIYATGKPIVLILLNGGPLSIPWEDKHIPAILEAWYPGEAGGAAIADVLFGDYNPSGRLPVTVYRSVDQLPAFTDYSMQGRTYRYFKGKTLYPFGYGLSYTSFKYTNVRVQQSRITPNDSTILSVEITNTGTRDGEEVVQLYVKADHDTMTVKTLKGFQRIALKCGETKRVEFPISSETLSRWMKGKGFSVEPDTYALFVGPSSDIEHLQKVQLLVR